MSEKYQELKGELLLLLTSIIWGLSFVAQKLGMEHNGPFTFSAVRLTIGWIVLIPVYLLFRKKGNRETHDPKTQRLASGLAGIMIFLGVSAQQVALQTTTAGKTAFITALYIVLVPIAGYFLGKKVGVYAWIAVAFGSVGLYFLSVSGDFTIAIGDVIVFLGAFAWTAQILIVDHYVKKIDPILMSLQQFLVAGTLSFLVALLTENITMSGIMADLPAILFAGVIVVGVAYTLQIIGQKTVPPHLAAMLMSFESVFALLFGWLFLKETLSQREVFGCLLMFLAVLIAQKKSAGESSSQE